MPTWKKVLVVLFSIVGVIGLVGCAVNNGLTGGLLSLPYAGFIALATYLVYKKFWPSFITMIGLYLLTILLNPLCCPLMEKEATEATYRLVFTKDAYLVKIPSKTIKQSIFYDVLSKKELDSTKELLGKDYNYQVLHTFKEGSEFKHAFTRDLSGWLDGETYQMDMSYLDKKITSPVTTSFGKLLQSSDFADERFLELYQGDKKYERSVFFYLSQSANWPALYLTLGSL